MPRAKQYPELCVPLLLDTRRRSITIRPQQPAGSELFGTHLRRDSAPTVTTRPDQTGVQVFDLAESAMVFIGPQTLLPNFLRQGG